MTPLGWLFYWTGAVSWACVGLVAMLVVGAVAWTALPKPRVTRWRA